MYRKVELQVKTPSTQTGVKKADELSLAVSDSIRNRERIAKMFNQRGVPIKLNILFAVNSYMLVEDVKDDLMALTQYLTDNNQLKIELAGHVCCNNDVMLSKGRAVAVKNYLVRKGIAEERISCVGHGNRKPAVKEVDPQTEAINRRVEVTFLSD